MEGKVELSVDGRSTGPKPGQLFRNIGMANVLRQLGEKGAKESFYSGPPGKAIVDAIQRHGGSMTVDDLTNHSSTFVEPVHVEYHGINRRRMGLLNLPPHQTKTDYYQRIVILLKHPWICITHKLR